MKDEIHNKIPQKFKRLLEITLIIYMPQKNESRRHEYFGINFLRLS